MPSIFKDMEILVVQPSEVNNTKKSLAVYCYEADGNKRKSVSVQASDVLEWKRNGTRGAYLGTLL